MEMVREAMKDSSNGSVRVQSLCKKIEDAEVKWQSYAKLLGELKRSRRELDELCRQEHCEKLNYAESKEKKLFEKMFGLELKRNEDSTVTLVFGHLLASDPQITCSVTMDINSDNKWEVVNVQQGLKGVSELVQELNSTFNFGMFCKKIREQFKTSLQQ